MLLHQKFGQHVMTLQRMLHFSKVDEKSSCFGTEHLWSNDAVLPGTYQVGSELAACRVRGPCTAVALVWSPDLHGKKLSWPRWG